MHLICPSLIFAHLTAWGRAGPKQNDPGYDTGAFWAATGLQDLLKSSDDAQPPRFPGAIGDHNTGMHLLGGVALALFHRDRTGGKTNGEGQLVDASLLRSGVWSMSLPLLLASMGENDLMKGAGAAAARDTRVGNNPSMVPMQAKDGVWFQLLGLETHRHLPGVLRAMGLGARTIDQRSGEAVDDRFSNVASCVRNRRELIPLMDGVFKTKDADHWRAAFDTSGVWYVQVARIEDVINDEQVIAAGSFTSTEGPRFDTSEEAKAKAGYTPKEDAPAGTTLIANPIRLSCSDAHGPQGSAPALGQHTTEVLLGLGYDKQQIAKARASSKPK
jgi:crotonobetainyl-CoA:carnitine CoA-transferase CaiB-like acyl-CoA transferase